MEEKNYLEKWHHFTKLIRSHSVFGVILSWLLVFIAFSILGKNFFTFQNIIGIFSTVSELGIMTIGVAFLVISKEFDLSVGSVYASAGFIFSVLASRGLFSPLAFIVAIAFGASVGFINGLITLRTRIPSFITTLGTLMIVKGVLLALTKGTTSNYLGDRIMPTILASRMAFGLRPSHFWFLGLTILFIVILNRTKYGNWVFAIGGGEKAAITMGVSKNRVKLINFTISGLLAGLAGCIVTSRLLLANPTFGTGVELEVIAAVVIGGTLLTGGKGTILGAFFGAFMMGMVRNGLLLSGAPGYWYQAFIGVILIIAASIHIKMMQK